MGPFLDINNVDIFSGDLFYENQDKTKTYVSHEELFKDLINTIQKELNGIKTKVIFVPSHKDLHHFEPVPQAPFLSNYFPTNSFPTTFMSVSNPCTLIVKDLCMSMLPKNMEPPKIDLSLKGILE